MVWGICALYLQLFGIFFYGGVFLINTQVAAIGIHSVFNAILVRPRYPMPQNNSFLARTRHGTGSNRKRIFFC